MTATSPQRSQAVQVIKDFRGVTTDQYELLIDRLGLSPGGQAPPGCLIHIATHQDNGMRVVELWQDRNQFQTHLESKVLPTMTDLNLSPPDLDVTQVYTFMTTGQQAQQDVRGESVKQKTR